MTQNVSPEYNEATHSIPEYKCYPLRPVKIVPMKITVPHIILTPEKICQIRPRKENSVPVCCLSIVTLHSASQSIYIYCPFIVPHIMPATAKNYPSMHCYPEMQTRYGLNWPGQASMEWRRYNWNQMGNGSESCFSWPCEVVSILTTSWGELVGSYLFSHGLLDCKLLRTGPSLLLFDLLVCYSVIFIFALHVVPEL